MRAYHRQGAGRPVRIALRGSVSGLVALALSSSFVACGGAHDGNVVARVNGAAITQTTLARWMAVYAPQHLVPDPPLFTDCLRRLAKLLRGGFVTGLRKICQEHYEALRQRALDFLISTRWLLGEATARGVAPSRREVEEEMKHKADSYPGGDKAATDVELEIKAALASARLRQLVADRERAVGEGEIAGYYRQHAHSFAHRERRVFYLLEYYPSRAAADALRSKILHGLNIAGASRHEELERPANPSKAGESVKEIFATKPHVLTPPLKADSRYFLVEVTQVVPPTVESLAQAQGTIASEIARQRTNRALARSVEAWRRKWTALTECRPGYVIQRCREYSGPRSEQPRLRFG